LVVECSQAEADKRGLTRAECDQALATECARAFADGRGSLPVACGDAAATAIGCTQAEADRRGLTRTECNKVVATECAQTDTGSRAAESIGGVECRYGLFDLAVAHELYDALVGPVEALLKD
jgi:hypothetical protein